MTSTAGDISALNTSTIVKAIVAYQRAADGIAAILGDVRQLGRLQQPWTQDDVSIGIAEYYNDQIFMESHGSYAALSNFESELRGVSNTLEQMLVNYTRMEADAAASFN